MKRIKKIWAFILFDTYGNIALASFIICIVSGFILAVPYNVQAAYDSIALMLITNLPGIIFRNMHYWSAQIFLIFTLLHTWEHLKLRSAVDTGSGVWLRLVVSLMVLFFVMIYGFILKADVDSLQARRILETLLSDIPFTGKLMSGILFGNKDSFQLIYVHHIATATIILVFIIFEHAKVLWSKRSTFLITLAVITLLSFFIHAPLHNNINPVLKGPWYFVGFQEVLHWMEKPAWIWMFLILFLFFLFALKYVNENKNHLAVWFILFLSAVYLVLTIIGFYFRGENWEWQSPCGKNKYVKSVSLEIGFQKVSSRFAHLTAYDIPVVQGRREACMNCHTGLTGFSPSHDPKAIGCTSCHLGNPFTLDPGKAHKNMVLIPGNLANANISCGTTSCHPEISERINTSMMTTNSGIVSVDRFVFGENHSPDILSHIKDIGHSAADKHLRDLCAKCHLGNEKLETGSVDQMTRGGGCTACHLNYTRSGVDQHFAYISGQKIEELLPSIHPSLDINISNDHCFGCHSRSGRISTNYEGWHETLFDEADVIGQTNYRILQDKRVFEFISADVHHELGLECIDCHNSYEVMGDGKNYFHEEQAVKINCEDCHFSEIPETISYKELETEQKKIFDLRKFGHTDKKMIVGKNFGLPLINAFYENEESYMITKNAQELHLLSPPANVCTKSRVHSKVSCSACHTTWAPQCIGCHNEFDKEAQGFDLLENKFVKGEWVEYVGTFLAEPPTLGVREDDKTQIEPAIPGMIMTIDKGSFYSSDESIIFHRLFAPAAPHTTSVNGRSCKSCHNNPLAIGYGRGMLIFEINNGVGKWKFTPEFAENKYDGLPEDAWIEFLSNSSDDFKSSDEYSRSTRTDFRPFNIEEQRRILRVGACLSCHAENSEIILKSLDEDLESYLLKISGDCVLPVGF
ncbi:MAG: cytochrome b N-terminal domain-containing protein [Bacteroidales bacterium]|nr:cytochrome b N-terminal domain-containing protein [Bacteroidales bacterium]